MMHRQRKCIVLLLLASVLVMLTGMVIMTSKTHFAQFCSKIEIKHQVKADHMKLKNTSPVNAIQSTTKRTSLFSSKQVVDLVKSEKPKPTIKNSSLQRIVQNEKNVETGEKFMKRMQRRQEERKSVLAKACHALNLESHHDSGGKVAIILAKKYRLAYCGIPKAGCSNMKRIMLELNGLFNISSSEIHETAGGKFGLILNLKEPSIITRHNFTNILLVRHPYERLVSSYHNKVKSPSVIWFQKRSKEIRNLYGNSSKKHENENFPLFEEFIDFLGDSKRNIRHNGVDSHWNTFNDLCHPCVISYDVIAHLETAEEDVRYIMKLIGAPPGIKFNSGYSKSGESKSAKKTNIFFQKVNKLQKDKLYQVYKYDFKLFGYSNSFQ